MNTISAVAQESSNAPRLNEVVVQGQKQPYRGDVPLESLPQQVQLISGDMLDQLGKVNFQNALDMAGGVARQNSFGGLWDCYSQHYVFSKFHQISPIARLSVDKSGYRLSVAILV
jgi:iron complex outermembrane receptor protein